MTFLLMIKVVGIDYAVANWWQIISKYKNNQFHKVIQQ
jgi:hypothetical protein